MYKITANSPFTGCGYSLTFDKGVAYTNDRDLAEYLRKKGYTVEPATVKKAKKTDK